MTGHSVRSKLTGKFAIAVLFLMTLILTACGGGGNATPSGTAATTLRMLTAPGQPNADLFNPYDTTNQGSAAGTQGLLYESLYFTNLYNGKTEPWLASSYSFGNGGQDLTQITFMLNTSIKWNDNQPLTADDVVFTFNEMKTYPALDNTGVMPLISSVTATDQSTVVFKLTHPDSTALFRLGDQIYIVPKHIWANHAGDPTKWPNDSNPVGTGPYLLKTYNPNLITYTVNPNYWGTKPAVKTIEVPSIKDNTTAITQMIQGQLDWMGTGWNPSYDPLYSLKDPKHNLTWFAGSNTVMLYLNLQKAPFNDLNVRKAISAAIVRSGLPNGVAQYAPVANVTGVITSLVDTWVSSQYKSAQFESGQSKVTAYMTAAGYHMDSAGFFADASGKELDMTVDVPGSWSDWAQDVQNIVTDLNTAGIKAEANFQSGYTPYYTAISTGTYDAAISWTNSGPDPYFAYQGLLLSTNSAAPGGTISGTNFERWDASDSNGYSAKVDQYLTAYEATSDQTAKIAAIQGIEDIMVSQLPVLPLTVNVYWDEYTTRNWTNFPDASNPYDSGAPYNMPDAEHVILNLKPAN